MPISSVGAVATLLNTVASWLLSENGYAEFSLRRKAAALRKAADEALKRRDLAEHARLVDELEQLFHKS